jgi:hypothetical protein
MWNSAVVGSATHCVRSTGLRPRLPRATFDHDESTGYAKKGGAGRLLAERLILRMRLPSASAFFLAQVDDDDRYVVRRVELVAAGVEELLRALGRGHVLLHDALHALVWSCSWSCELCRVDKRCLDDCTA